MFSDIIIRILDIMNCISSYVYTGENTNSAILISTLERRQSKPLSTFDERGSKSLETVFSIVICRQSGDKLQSKTLFITIFDLRLSIILSFSITAYPVWYGY